MLLILNSGVDQLCTRSSFRALVAGHGVRNSFFCLERVPRLAWSPFLRCGWVVSWHLTQDTGTFSGGQKIIHLDFQSRDHKTKMTTTGHQHEHRQIETITHINQTSNNRFQRSLISKPNWSEKTKIVFAKLDLHITFFPWVFLIRKHVSLEIINHPRQNSLGRPYVLGEYYVPVHQLISHPRMVVNNTILIAALWCSHKYLGILQRRTWQHNESTTMFWRFSNPKLRSLLIIYPCHFFSYLGMETSKQDFQQIRLLELITHQKQI